MAAGGNAIYVILRSTESRYFYTCKRNKRAEKLSLKKYDPIVNKHVQFVEEKIK